MCAENSGVRDAFSGVQPRRKETKKLSYNENIISFIVSRLFSSSSFKTKMTGETNKQKIKRNLEETN